MAVNPKSLENLRSPQLGEIRNPKGRGKGTKNLSTWIQDMLNDEEFETYLQDPKKGLIEYKGAPVKAIVKTAVIKAVAGEKESREWLAKYGYGTKLELANNPENPITGISDPQTAADFAAFLKERTKQ